MAKQNSKPKVISVVNMKGGVGKTTLSVNIAYIITKYHNKKVLLIDVDPQFNATQYLVTWKEIVAHFEKNKTVLDIIMPKKEESIDLVNGKKKKKDKEPKLKDFIINISKTNGSYLDIIPSTLELIEIENSVRGAEHRLKNFIKKNCKHYDIIMIDCPPTIGIHTLSAFLASSYYLIPIKPDHLSSLGLSLLERVLTKYKNDHNHKLTSLGLVFTMVKHNNYLTPQIMKEIRNSGRSCATAYSTDSVRVAESVTDMDSFYNRSGQHQSEFIDITQEILNKL